MSDDKQKVLLAIKKLRIALVQLAEILESGSAVHRAYIEMDIAASALRELFPDLLSPTEDVAPSALFQMMCARGWLDLPAVAAAKGIEEAASQQWYDEASKNATRLHDAERHRETLHEALVTFVKKLLKIEVAAEQKAQ